MMNNPSCEQRDTAAEADDGGLRPILAVDAGADQLVDQQELLLSDNESAEARGIVSRRHVGDTAPERPREEEDLRLLSRLQHLDSSERVSNYSCSGDG